mgnify:CR=1 FL=1
MIELLQGWIQANRLALKRQPKNSASTLFGQLVVNR